MIPHRLCWCMYVTEPPLYDGQQYKPQGGAGGGGGGGGWGWGWGGSLNYFTSLFFYLDSTVEIHIISVADAEALLHRQCVIKTKQPIQ